MITTRAHNGEGEATRHSDRNAAVGEVSITELADLIFPPTVRRARAREGARVVGSRAQSSEFECSRHAVGIRLIAVFPSPNCPDPSFPPSSRLYPGRAIPQVWAPPVLIETKAILPVTGPGALLSLCQPPELSWKS